MSLWNNEDVESASENLKRCEQILENLASEGRDVDRNQIIVVLHNLAWWYQRSAMLDDWVSYLDGTIFNIQSKITDFEEISHDFSSVIVKDEINNLINNEKQTQNQPLTEEISRKLTISSKFQKLRYLSRLHLQLGAVLSQINKHEEALYHGKTAALYWQDLIKNTELLCKDYLEKISHSQQKENIKKKYLSSPAQK